MIRTEQEVPDKVWDLLEELKQSEDRAEQERIIKRIWNINDELKED